MKTILFVCKANLHRSPLCEGLCQEEIRIRNLNNRFEADSAGISGFHKGNPPGRFVNATLHFYDISYNHLSKPVSDINLTTDFILVAVDRACYNDLSPLAEKFKIPLFILSQFENEETPSDIRFCTDIPDPYLSPNEDFFLYIKLVDIVLPSIMNLVGWLEKNS